MSKRPLPPHHLLLYIIVLCWVSFSGTVYADPTPTTSTECQQIQAFFLGDSTLASECCNVTTPSQYFYAGCNAQGQVTSLRYTGMTSGHVCNDATIGALQGLTALETLTLDYYLDQSLCPSFFTPGFFQSLQYLTTLTIRGSKVFSTPVANTTNVATTNAVEFLDLSYSTVDLSAAQGGPPEWLVALFSQLKSLAYLIVQSPTTTPNFNCGSVSNLTLDVVTSSSSPRILQWIATNCTLLTYLDLHVHANSYQQDISAWLEPLGTSLPGLVGLAIELVDGVALSKFPSWIGRMSNLTTLTYRANVYDELNQNVLSQLPLTVLDMRGNTLYGDLPATLSSVQLVQVDLSGNQLSGNIPQMFANSTSCDLRDNPILCAGVGNSWGVCDKCKLIPGFLDVMLRYKIEWTVIAVCLLIVLCGWVYVAFKRHQQTSFRVWLGVFYSLFSFINLLTTIIYLGLNIRLYKASFSLMLVSTVIPLGANAWIYKYCCHRFNILLIRRTWPVFFVCVLDMNNFSLYEIRMLNLSAYREPIDMRVSTVLSWIKVIIADVPHTGISIFLLMLHAPVASILLTCITSGIGLVRGIIQILVAYCRSRRQHKSNPILIEQKGMMMSTIHSESDMLSSHSMAVTFPPATKEGIQQQHRADAELTHLINSKESL